jgi:hypothetical protein
LVALSCWRCLCTSEAGIGRPSRKPWASSQPIPRTLQRVLRLGAFGGDACAQRMAELRDAVEDGIGLQAVVGHERPVDLDLVERKFAQMAQRGITGSEIVQRHFNAERAKLLQEPEIFPGDSASIPNAGRRHGLNSEAGQRRPCPTPTA